MLGVNYWISVHLSVELCMNVTVVIQSNADLPPLAEDTILFLEDRLVLGKVTSQSTH